MSSLRDSAGAAPGDADDIFDVVGSVALGFGTGALVLSVAGITMIRTRGRRPWPCWRSCSRSR